MKKIAITLTAVLGTGIGLFVLAGRSTTDMAGYVRASADTAVDGATESLPAEVHDRKLDHEVQQVRQEMIDRQVQMNLSERQIEELQAEVTRLEDSAARRQRLLAEAYPVLNEATRNGVQIVSFASEDYALAEFQQEVDDLLSMQEREERELEIKRSGLERLRKSVTDGEQALAEMRRQLDETEQEVAVLRSRREQAETESQTLDLVSEATADTESVTGLMSRGVERLRTQVDGLEARNAARRDIAPVRVRESGGAVSRSFNRLESLKAIHDAVAEEPNSEADPSDNSTAATPSDNPDVPKPKTDSKVVISIEGSDTSECDE